MIEYIKSLQRVNTGEIFRNYNVITHTFSEIVIENLLFGNNKYIVKNYVDKVNKLIPSTYNISGINLSILDCFNNHVILRVSIPNEGYYLFAIDYHKNNIVGIGNEHKYGKHDFNKFKKYMTVVSDNNLMIISDDNVKTIDMLKEIAGYSMFEINDKLLVSTYDSKRKKSSYIINLLTYKITSLNGDYSKMHLGEIICAPGSPDFNFITSDDKIVTRKNSLGNKPRTILYADENKIIFSEHGGTIYVYDYKNKKQIGSLFFQQSNNVYFRKSLIGDVIIYWIYNNQIHEYNIDKDTMSKTVIGSDSYNYCYKFGNNDVLILHNTGNIHKTINTINIYKFIQ